MGWLAEFLGKLLGLPQLVSDFIAWIKATVLGWFKTQAVNKEIDEGAQGQTDNLKEVLDNESATPEEIDTARRDSLDHL